MRLKLPTVIHRLLKASSFWKDNQLILREIRFFPKIAVLSLLFPMLAAIFEGFGIGFLLAFLQTLVNADAEPVRSGVEWIDVWVLGANGSKLDQLFRVSALILLSTWIRAIFNYLTAVYTSLARIRLVDRLYRQIFEQLQSLSLSFFGQTQVGNLVNTLTSEVGQLQQFLGSFSFLLTKGLVLLVYAVIAISISWQLTLASVLLFSLMAVGLSTLNRQVRELSFPVSQARGEFTAIASEFINGIRTVQAFATQEFERQRFYRVSDEIAETNTQATMQMSIVRPLAEAAASTILIGMIVVGMSVFVSSGALQVGALLTFIFLLFRLVPAIQEINGSLASMGSMQGSLHAIEELLRRDNKPYLQNGHRQFTNLQRAIEFVSVDFGYGDESSVLHNITLTISKGQTIALVGSSGAGKSTLADLIPRFYDTTQGDIQLDGVSLREFDITSVRQRIAMVSQETFIFNTSVRNNIAYGIDVDDVEVMKAAKLANATEFIEELPQGLDTVLGDRGVRLSGGQRQRIAIARALLRNPEILILDEATSALDSVSERLIQASIEQLSVGRTVIAIAHRLSTIRRADKVVVLEQGQIIEQGTYQELLAQRGKLWNYHQMQNSSALNSTS
ncbi:ABC transporter ATP-binding protein [Phormidium sp. CLA17]|uniref:heterocyst formation ABC transporter subunit HepA n=1 Tax=Leptolyngbya sp. Cla-17 TaxID=2803751 RepID=UPI001492D743|nr:heterocyst formation ABC transporter subunit HepA [Leptolyngbya sp. Cla-17]MBM0741086.1 ABC transporter ATP-binding protein [Leptolyngbya sp. Cla-17]